MLDNEMLMGEVYEESVTLGQLSTATLSPTGRQGFEGDLSTATLGD